MQIVGDIMVYSYEPKVKELGDIGSRVHEHQLSTGATCECHVRVGTITFEEV